MVKINRKPPKKPGTVGKTILRVGSPDDPKFWEDAAERARKKGFHEMEKACLELAMAKQRARARRPASRRRGFF